MVFFLITVKDLLLANMLGGNFYYNICASLFTPIPFIPSTSPIYGHLFMNSGNLISTDGRNLKNVTDTLYRNSRLTIGAGIALRFSILRAEFNYILPIAATTTDSVKHGFQFGIGMEFS